MGAGLKKKGRRGEWVALGTSTCGAGGRVGGGQDVQHLGQGVQRLVQGAQRLGPGRTLGWLMPVYAVARVCDWAARP